MHCKLLWIRASDKCIHRNVNIICTHAVLHMFAVGSVQTPGQGASLIVFMFLIVLMFIIRRYN